MNPLIVLCLVVLAVTVVAIVMVFRRRRNSDRSRG